VDVLIRRVTREDLAEINRVRNNKFVLDNCWNNKPTTYEEREKWFESIVEDQDSFEYCICLDDEVVGQCSLKINPQNKRAEFGIYVTKECVGKGIAKEAMRQLLFIGFEGGLHKIYGQVFAFNKKALRFYEKLGFKREATLKDQLYRDGRFYDVHIVSIIEEE